MTQMKKNMTFHRRKVQKAQNDLQDFQNEMRLKEQNVKKFARTLEDLEAKLQTLLMVENLKKAILQGQNRDAYDGMIWLRNQNQNQNTFKVIKMFAYILSFCYDV